ncbi:glycosyl transferase family 1 [Devosia limi DSM 17137]|uniref:Glycosyl transferase family 1 n=1 Tax=Devosia limi DSM 17137 TaxID=1121477 RepID=A0A0F5LGF5_9HYPH|nr:glycosyltransferase [Devosia limi]KKB80637.1 glycosyl transferase family 1 [Devosia limi DSM 17137]SHE50032.1 Glycosyltransferase involved in cell wall bisynthesis [Devosia limi DSM 17137]
MNHRPKVLLIAEACNPEWVSVPLVGWSMASALRGVADVHIVSQIRNRDALVRAGLVEGVDFTAIDSERIARPLWRLATVLRMGEGRGWTTVQAIDAISYRYFERLVWRLFGSSIKSGEFDIVHRLTPLSPTIPSSLAGKCRKAGVPFVIGPLNGGVPWPRQFDAERRREREWLSYVRSAYKLLPGRRQTLRASAIMVGSRHTEAEIPEQFRPHTIYLPENGIDPDRFSHRADHQPGTLRACFVGRMVPYKGPDMVLQAAAPMLREGLMRLDFVGDGPMLEELKAQAIAEGIADAVTFHGWVAHQRVQEILSRSTLFAFPSIREFGGGAVLEAMALGVPPLIVDYAGPGELVDAGTGFKVPLGSREEIVAALRAAMGKLASEPDLLRETGKRARDRVETHFLWSRKAEQVLEVYGFALGQRERPQPLEAAALAPDRLVGGALL